MFNVPKKEEQLEIQVKREHLFILCLISSSKFMHYYLCQPTKYQGPLFASTSELNRTLRFSLTKGPIGLDAPIQECVGRTVLNSKQIRFLTVHPLIKSYSVIVASPRALCSSDFNTSMLAKPSVLVNLVVLTKRPTRLGAPIHTRV